MVVLDNVTGIVEVKYDSMETMLVFCEAKYHFGASLSVSRKTKLEIKVVDRLIGGLCHDRKHMCR